MKLISYNIANYSQDKIDTLLKWDAAFSDHHAQEIVI